VKCPFCAFLDDKVIDSREGRAGDAIRRRRECLKCARRFTTYERVEESAPMVVKKDNRREPFDRAKIIAGIKKACEKRPVSMETIEEMADRIGVISSGRLLAEGTLAELRQQNGRGDSSLEDMFVALVAGEASAA